MKKILTTLLMLTALSLSAQVKKYDFNVYSGKDTAHVITSGGYLVLDWKDGCVDMYPYDIGVYEYEHCDMICFDEFDIARFAIVFYTKKHKLDHIMFQANNGMYLILKPIKK
jgi:hypothetical protein